MKKISAVILAITAVTMISCQRETIDSGALTGEVEFTVTAGIPGGISTYADGVDAFSHNGGAVNVDPDKYDLRYILEVYTKDQTPVRVYRKTVIVPDNFTTTDVTITARLVAKTYDFVFWADFVENGSAENTDGLYYNTDPLTQVSYKDNVTLATLATEAIDAYCHVEEVDLSTNQNISGIKLHRPFGKIRLLATDKLTEGVDQDEYPAETKVAAPYNGVYFVINLQDNDLNKIVVKGGKFENCDPSNTNTEPATVSDNFVADGYSSIKISDDPAVFEVVKAHVIENSDDLMSAIYDIAVNGGAITIDESAAIAVSGLGTLSIEKPTTITVNGSINSTEEEFMLVNNSTLILKGEGSVNLQRRVVENHGTLIVEGGHYSTENTTGGTAFWNNSDGATMTLNNVEVDASHFAVAGKGRIEINGGRISSISSNKYGAWAYCIRAQEGGTMTIRDAVIEGVQGCIASIESSHIILEDVNVSARNSESGRQDAFYAIYAASLGVIEVISGDFYSDRTPCALASDDDLEGAPLGGFILKGGRFSSYPKNDDGSIWQPESGFKYEETEDTTFPYAIVSE